MTKNKAGWIKIPEENIEITSEQQFNGKKYPEILELVKEEEIASYELLQRLRNTRQYKFLEDFWVFVPNPDKISKKNNYVAGFCAGLIFDSDSVGAGFDYRGHPW